MKKILGINIFHLKDVTVKLITVHLFKVAVLISKNGNHCRLAMILTNPPKCMTNVIKLMKIRTATNTNLNHLLT